MSPVNRPEPVFLVNGYSDPVVVKINGRATYLNSAPVYDFFKNLIASGRRRFVVDFHNCQAMDSTFMGILAGAGLMLHKTVPPGELVLARLNQRNLELVQNLGLHRIMHVDQGAFPQPAEGLHIQPTASAKTEVEKARLILQAHENLVEIDETNRARFQDVIIFLKNQIGGG